MNRLYARELARHQKKELRILKVILALLVLIMLLFAVLYGMHEKRIRAMEYRYEINFYMGD